MTGREWLFETEGHRVVVLAVINGLTSEIDTIKEALERYRPDAIGVPVTAAQVENLRHWNPDEQQADYSDFDLLYIREMSRFGKVVLPSPSHLYPVAAADASKIEIVALDMDDEKYAELYMENVKPTSLFFDSILRKRWMRKSIEGNVDDVVLQLDAIGKHPDGMGVIEEKPDRHMAQGKLETASRHGTFLALVDFERAAGIRKHIEEASGML